MGAVTESSPRAGGSGPADHVHHHSVHGLVTLRLEDAPRRIISRLVAELDPSADVDTPEPDIVIRFVDKIKYPSSLRLFVYGQAAYDESHFYLFDKDGRTSRLELDRVGTVCHILCERDVSAIPLMMPIVSIKLLAKGYVLLHSAAFTYRGKGVLVAGWKKGGKSETLLPFIAEGASYLSDEWTIIGDDRRLRGLASVLRLWSWHLRQLPEFWARTPRRDRTRIRLLRAYQRAYRALPAHLRGRGLVADIMRRAGREGGLPLGVVRLPPDRLLGEHPRQSPVPLDRLLLATVAEGEISVNPIEAAEVADRMVASLAFERGQLMKAYHQYRFAFPDRVNPYIESASQREAEILREALGGTPAFEVVHPYPVSLTALFEAVEHAVL